VAEEQSKMLRAALTYAQRLSWAVIPLHEQNADGTCSCGKADCTSQGKHPRLTGWQEKGTADDRQIARWWRQWPNANVGVVAGLSGLVVIDVDNKHGIDGSENWRAFCHDQGITEAGACENLTPNHGRHLVWKAPDGTRIGNSGAGLPAGVDVRADGGFIVVPPSETNTGTYTWEMSGHPLDQAPGPAPIALVDLLTKHPEAERTPRFELPEAVKAGGRNKTLFRFACSLRTKGMDGAELLAAVQVVNAERCKPPLDMAELETIVESALHYEPGAAAPLANGDERPAIDAGIQDLDRVTNAAWGVLETTNDPPLLFVHGGQLTRLELGEPAPTLATIDVDRLRYEASRVARWYTRRKVDGLWEDVDARPPVVVMRNMLARPTGELALPPVDRIVRSPVFAFDGTLQRAPGYHAGGRVIVCTDPELVIPEIPQRPTNDQVQAAVATIDDLLHDFPFTGAADRAHAFALLLGPLVRDMIPGPTPLHLVESATPGSGKGLLASVLLTPALGDAVATMAAGRDDEEWRKRLTTILRAGQPAVVIDNVRESIDAAPLSSALTASWWDDRILGANDLLHLPVRCVWAATGNNPMLSTEIARRTVRIRVDPKMDQPWRREASTFTHPELLTYAQERRGAVLAAGLTLTQAWIAAGQPRAKTPPLGSYEPWVRVIGGILAHAKIDGFLANLDELYERADSEGAVWRRFVGAWWEAHEDKAVGVADLYPLALELEDFPLGNGKERAQKTRLGKGLKEKEDVVLAGYRIESAGTYQGAQRYRLRRTYTDMAGEPGEPSELLGLHQQTIMSDHGLGGDVHGVHEVHQDPDLAAECCVCGAPVECYGPNGEAWCAEHGAECCQK